MKSYGNFIDDNRDLTDHFVNSLNKVFNKPRSDWDEADKAFVNEVRTFANTYRDPKTRQNLLHKWIEKAYTLVELEYKLWPKLHDYFNSLRGLLRCCDENLIYTKDNKDFTPLATLFNCFMNLPAPGALLDGSVQVTSRGAVFLDNKTFFIVSLLLMEGASLFSAIEPLKDTDQITKSDFENCLKASFDSDYYTKFYSNTLLLITIAYSEIFSEHNRYLNSGFKNEDGKRGTILDLFLSNEAQKFVQENSIKDSDEEKNFKDLARALQEMQKAGDESATQAIIEHLHSKFHFKHNKKYKNLKRALVDIDTLIGRNSVILSNPDFEPMDYLWSMVKNDSITLIHSFRTSKLTLTEFSEYITQSAADYVVECIKGFGVKLPGYLLEKLPLCFIKAFVQNGVDLDAKNGMYRERTALFELLHCKDFEHAKMLIKMGADVFVQDDSDQTVLEAAVIERNIGYQRKHYSRAQRMSEVVKFLVSYDAHLFNAIEKGEFDYLVLMIKNGARINAKDENGRTLPDIIAESDQFSEEQKEKIMQMLQDKSIIKEVEELNRKLWFQKFSENTTFFSIALGLSMLAIGVFTVPLICLSAYLAFSMGTTCYLITQTAVALIGVLSFMVASEYVGSDGISL